jgi:hypothetical protein
MKPSSMGEEGNLCTHLITQRNPVHFQTSKACKGLRKVNQPGRRMLTRGELNWRIVQRVEWKITQDCNSHGFILSLCDSATSRSVAQF